MIYNHICTGFRKTFVLCKLSQMLVYAKGAAAFKSPGIMLIFSQKSSA
jgi:hypothetical protein